MLKYRATVAPNYKYAGHACISGGPSSDLAVAPLGRLVVRNDRGSIGGGRGACVRLGPDAPGSHDLPRVDAVHIIERRAALFVNTTHAFGYD